MTGSKSLACVTGLTLLSPQESISIKGGNGGQTPPTPPPPGSGTEDVLIF